MKKIHGAVIQTNIFLAAVCIVNGYHLLLYAELVVWFCIMMRHLLGRPDPDEES